ncbi:MAG TPA: nuclear transport factor 2 family protein [Candidatus Bathyarchaeia archaeon]|nr:nuclear transport factor 2 family protein [Candidatus Bathyarchaeia archaeon]
MAQTHQVTGPASADIAETITRMEEQWAAAAKENDPAKVAPMLSEVFIEMDSDGTLYDKSQTLDRIKSAKWEVFELSDMKVTVHGNLAIAAGAWRGKGTLGNGKTVDEHERWLDTWLKNGKWQCIASASAPIKS